MIRGANHARQATAEDTVAKKLVIPFIKRCTSNFVDWNGFWPPGISPSRRRVLCSRLTIKLPPVEPIVSHGQDGAGKGALGGGLSRYPVEQ